MDRIKQLAKKWGVKLSKRGCYWDFAYNGKTIALFDSDPDDPELRTESNIIHDIAHFVVAAKRRRKLPEFGLGTSPDTISSFTPRDKKVSARQAQTEEELASALGIYWEREFGMNWRKTYKDHYWHHVYDSNEQKTFDLTQTHQFAVRLQKLKKRKII